MFSYRNNRYSAVPVGSSHLEVSVIFIFDMLYLLLLIPLVCNNVKDGSLPRIKNTEGIVLRSTDQFLHWCAKLSDT